jgi:hypothetical protein
MDTFETSFHENLSTSHYRGMILPDGAKIRVHRRKVVDLLE